MNLIIKDKTFYQQVFSIMIPVSLQGLITVGVSLSDTMMLGSLGEITLSAAALANQFAFIFLICNYGLGGGAGVLSGQFFGKKDMTSIKRMLTILLFASILFALLFASIALFFPTVVMNVYSTEADVIAQGASYLRILAIGFIFQGITVTTSTLLRTVRAVKVPMYAALVAFFLNVILNYILIFGKFGAPTLGIQGAAIATTCARIVEFTIILIYVFKLDKIIMYRVKDLFKFDQAIFKQYLKIGSPVLISDLILAVGLSMVSVVLGRMGSDVVAANSIAAVVLQFMNIFQMGISNASGVMTGNTIGANESDKAFRQGVTFLLLATILGLISSTVIFSIKTFVIDFYNITPQTKLIALQLMNATAIYVVFSTPGTILTKGVLRAGGDTKFLMIADVLFLWLVSVPFGFITGVILGWPPFFVLLILKSDEFLKTIWCTYRLFSKKWIKNIHTN